MASKNRIEMLRTVQGMRPVDIASKLGVGERTAVRWERGDVQIPDERKLALARLFGVTVAFMMGWPEQPENDDGEQRAA